MKLKPTVGRAVRDPVKGTLLPEDGAIVQINAFWRNRLRDGDVVEVTEATQPQTSKATSAAASTATANGTTEDVS